MQNYIIISVVVIIFIILLRNIIDRGTVQRDKKDSSRAKANKRRQSEANRNIRESAGDIRENTSKSERLHRHLGEIFTKIDKANGLGED